MQFLTRIRNLVFGAPTTGHSSIVWIKTDETLEQEMAERIAILDALIWGYRSHDGVYVGTSAKTFTSWVEEHAQLKFRHAALTAKQKTKLVIDRLAEENVRLQNDLRAAENKYQRDVYGLNNEGDVIGGEPAGGFANDAAMYKKLWLDSLCKEITEDNPLNPGEYYWRFDIAIGTFLVVRSRDAIVDKECYRYFGPIQKPEIRKAYFDPPVESTNADQD